MRPKNTKYTLLTHLHFESVNVLMVLFMSEVPVLCQFMYVRVCVWMTHQGKCPRRRPEPGGR